MLFLLKVPKLHILPIINKYILAQISTATEFNKNSYFAENNLFNMLKKLLSLVALTILLLPAKAQTSFNANNRFEQLESTLPTPNSYRTASGSPGKDYWQQRADYDIKVELDDINRKIIGSETITYYNNSPDDLPYLWIQLDQNLFEKNSPGKTTKTGEIKNGISAGAFQELTDPKDYGYKIKAVK